jgi:hypothetical protein
MTSQTPETPWSEKLEQDMCGVIRTRGEMVMIERAHEELEEQIEPDFY